MKNNKPIFIAGSPRSGTTMLAGLLFHHGVWVGRAKTTDYIGTNPEFGSENIDIKDLMKQKALEIGYKNWTIPLPKQPEYEGIKERLDKYIPDNTRWLVKTSWTLIFSEFWINNYPNAYWLFPKREQSRILNSMNRHPRMRRRPQAMKKRFVKALHVRQLELSKTVENSLFVDIDKISVKNENELNKLFNYLDLEMSEKKVNDWIQPGLLKTSNK